VNSLPFTTKSVLNLSQVYVLTFLSARPFVNLLNQPIPHHLPFCKRMYYHQLKKLIVTII
jgi:hypothetical protein